MEKTGTFEFLFRVGQILLKFHSFLIHLLPAYVARIFSIIFVFCSFYFLSKESIQSWTLPYVQLLNNPHVKGVTLREKKT